MASGLITSWDIDGETVEMDVYHLLPQCLLAIITLISVADIVVTRAHPGY